MSAGSSAQGQQALLSFDGSTSVETKVLRPEKSDFFQAGSMPTPAIARGAGLSYAAASFGAGVVSVDHSRLDRIIDFCESENWIDVEAGVSLGKIYDFLIDKRLFLATQPGHPRITVGGCIAADIHGKNQFLDGTFMNQVISLKLFHPAHGLLELSADKDPELFRLSCGGYGLTGNIVSAKLALKAVPSAYAQMRLKPLDSIAELPASLQAAAAACDFVYSWHDFTLKGAEFGRGFLQIGNFCSDDSLGELKTGRNAAKQSLDANKRALLPFPVFNSLTIKLMNMLYGGRCRHGESTSRQTIFESVFPIQNTKELYFKFFGSAGFHEYQVIVPEHNFLAYTEGIKDYLAKNPLAVSLASAKLFAGRQDLLRFTGSGICFALNFARSAESDRFLKFLDRHLLVCRGIPNIIKDSRLSAQMVSQAYPQYDLFRRMLKDFDPQRLYKSELSERLSL